MRGPEGARDLVADYLRTWMPTKLKELAERLDVGIDELPAPALYGTADRPQLDNNQWPAIIATARSVGRYRMVEVDVGGETYEAAFRVRLYLAVRTAEADFEAVTDLRDRYVLAVTELIFKDLALGDPGTRVAPESFAVTLEGVGTDGNRTISGAWAEFEVTMAEIVSRSARETVARSLEVAPSHPALD